MLMYPVFVLSDLSEVKFYDQKFKTKKLLVSGDRGSHLSVEFLFFSFILKFFSNSFIQQYKQIFLQS